MGTSMKGIKVRIKSVESTMQITKAMELVSSSKLRKAKERAENSRPFFNILYETISDLSDDLDGTESVYTSRSEGLPSLYIVIAGDRGLAGGYNANVFRLLQEQPDYSGSQLILIGKKAIERYHNKPEVNVIAQFPDFAENLRTVKIKPITDIILSLFRKRKIGKVKIIFTQFVTALTQEATLLDILPLEIRHEKRPVGELMNYDPSPSAVLSSVVPQYVTGLIYGAVAESYASEQAARRTAMESATGNAEEMISSLQLSYNRARQSAITQELTEIVSGANAAQ